MNLQEPLLPRSLFLMNMPIIAVSTMLWSDFSTNFLKSLVVTTLRKELKTLLGLSSSTMLSSRSSEQYDESFQQIRKARNCHYHIRRRSLLH